MLPSFGKEDTGQYSEDLPSDNEVAEIVQVHINIYGTFYTKMGLVDFIL